VITFLLILVGLISGYLCGQLYWLCARHKPHRVILDEKDFADLVRGRPVAFCDSFIIIRLSDIGWDRMYFQIESAMREAGAEDI
jgi:hypothetical protein